MKQIFLHQIIISAAGAATALLLSGCEVKQTKEGEMPKVDVDVETTPGQLPAYDVETADVDVTKEKTEVLVPQVGLKREEVTVPDIDVTMPGEQREVATPVPTPSP